MVKYFIIPGEIRISFALALLPVRGGAVGVGGSSLGRNTRADDDFRGAGPSSLLSDIGCWTQRRRLKKTGVLKMLSQVEAV